MPKFDLQLECPIHGSFRVQQIAGMFDLDMTAHTTRRITAELPDLSDNWQIGAIVGPSGSGKTTIARHAFGNSFYQGSPWPTDRAVIDCFAALPIKQITRILTAVGFSSPPSWLKPYQVLSNGEKFRCELARALLGGTDLVAYDEFTSVVDRTVAKISSRAVAKAIRSGAVTTRFVAVTCHYDILPWLQPDWVLDMSDGTCKWASYVFHSALSIQHSALFDRGRLRLTITRTNCETWGVFRDHHYLSHALHRSSICFLARVDGAPAAFTAALPFPHPIRPGYREHRTVCLPDFQGVGIGSTVSDFVASLFVATGKPYFSRTSHPAMIAHRTRSPNWRMIRRPGMVSRAGPLSGSKTKMAETISRGRNTVGFEFVGKGRAEDAAHLGLLRNVHDCASAAHELVPTPGQSGAPAQLRPGFPVL